MKQTKIKQHGTLSKVEHSSNKFLKLPILVFIAVIFIFGMHAHKAEAFACASAGTGNWSAPATWTSCNSTIPQPGDTVSIGAHTVTLDTNTNVASISIATGGTLIHNSTVKTITLTGTSGVLFTKTGTFTPSTFIEVIVASASGTPTLLSAATTFFKLTINSTATVINSGAFGTTISGTGSKLYIQAGVFNPSGGALTGPGATGTFQIDAGATLCLGGTTASTTATCNSGASQTTARTMPTFQTYTFAPTSNVRYLSDAATSVSTTPTYGNLLIVPKFVTTARTYTLGNSALTINGDFTINADESSTGTPALTANAGGNITVAGTTTITRTNSATSILHLRPSTTSYNLSTGYLNIATGGTLNTGGTSYAGTITLNGTTGTLFTKAGTFTQGNSTVLVASASGTPTLLSASTTFHILKIASTATVINQGSTIVTDATAGNMLWIASGVLNQENRTITAGTAGTLQIDAGGTLCLGGTTAATNATCDSGPTQTVAQTMPTFTTYTLDPASTVRYLSDADVIMASAPAYGNLIIAPVQTATRTFRMGGTFTVNGTLTLTTGTLTAYDNNASIKTFSSSNTNTRAITMGLGTWTLTGTGTVWDTSTITGLTISQDLSTIKIIDTSSTAKIFSGGGDTYYNIWYAPGAGTGSLTLLGSNTFKDFKDDGANAHSLLFTAGTTTTVETFTVSGNTGQLISIDSGDGSGNTSTATHALTKTGGGMVSSDYLNIQHSAALPLGAWYAGVNSTNNQSVATTGSGWTFSTPPSDGAPYGGTAWAIPGTIQAEAYNLGGEGISYHDTTATNTGGLYRTGTNEGVDLNTLDASYAIVSTADGEWVKYSVNVNTTGLYGLLTRVSSVNAGTTMTVAMDGVTVATVSVPNTGATGSFQTVPISGISLTAGTHIMQLTMNTGVTSGFNLNYITFTSPTPYGGTARTIPGTIQAEDYDVGGELVAYHDNDSGNQGVAYRTSEGVDVETVSDTGGGYDVGWSNAGEWINYTVTVQTTATYSLLARVASISTGKSFQVQLDGSVIATVNVPQTGGYQTWQTVTVQNIPLTAGSHMLLVYDVTDGFNFNYLKFNTSPVANAGTDQTISTTTATLTGSGTDADGTIASYAWSFISGPVTPSITSASTASTGITGLSSAGTYVFRLTVTDNQGGTATDDINVVVSSTATQSKFNLSSATASVSGWTNIAGDPATGTRSALDNATGWGLRSIPANWDVSNGNNAFDGWGETVNDGGGFAMPAATIANYWYNTSSVFSTGVYQAQFYNLDPAKTYTVVILGSRSNANSATAPRITDYNVKGLSVLTTQSLDNFQNTSHTVSFSGVHPDASGIINIGVNRKADGTGGNFGYLNAITIADEQANISPTANAGIDQTIALPTTTTTLNGSGSDTDGTIASYAWSFISGPATPSITSATSASTGITGLSSTGTYVFRLTVTDNLGATGTDDINVVVNPDPSIKLYHVDFGLSTNQTSTTGWNNLNDTTTGGPTLTLVDSTGATTTRTLHITDSFYYNSGIGMDPSMNPNGTSSSTLYPASATGDSFFLGTVSSITDTSAQITVGSLNNSNTYDFKFYASRVAGDAGNRTTDYTIGATTVSLNATDNVDNTVSITGQSPSAGAIVININKNAAATFGYLGVLEITEHIAANSAPTANAGIDQTIALPTTTTTLNGSGSDTDGTIASYAWSFISGPATPSITSATSASTGITGLSSTGTYVFRLTVTDNLGATGTDDINVVVNASNVSPTANAGVDQTYNSGTTTATLSGSGSDTDGTIASYAWSFISGPATPSITSATSASTGITGLSSTGTYVFRLTVTDNLGATGTDDINVILYSTSGSYLLDLGRSTSQTATTGWNNIIDPRAGSPASLVDSTGATTATTFQITDSFYYDSGQAVDFSTNVNGTTTSTIYPSTATSDSLFLGTLNVTDNAATVVVSGLVNSYTYDFKFYASRMAGDSANRTTDYTISGTTVSLNATDNVDNFVSITGKSPTAGSITINISKNASATFGYLGVLQITEHSTTNVSPTANAGIDQSIQLPTTSVTLSGSGTDSDGTIASYGWSFISGPQTPTIATPTSASTSVTGLVSAGTYVFRLTVTDNLGATGTDNMNVVVNPSNVSPTANAGIDQSVTMPVSSVTLSGSGSDSDGTIASYSWSEVSSNYATITSPTSASTTVTDLAAGTYTFRLTVTDNLGATGTDDIIVTVGNHSLVSPTAKTIVVLGSSTSAGYGLTPSSDSYVNRFATYFDALATGNSVVNLAVGGYTTYHILPTGSSTANRPAPDTAHNITQALTYSPAAILVNMPSNDTANGYSATEQETNFQTLASTAAAANVPIYFTTTQPRNNFTAGQVTDQTTVRDWILSTYGSNAINFWTTFAMGDGTINPTYDQGDGIHLNNIAHKKLYARVAESTIIATVHNVVPTANAGVDQGITLPTTTTTLNGSGSDTDGTIASYAWSFISGPATPSITSATSASTGITGLSTTGTYVFRLTVTDNVGGTATDTINVIVYAAGVCASLGTGNWNTAGTWACGHVPDVGNDVSIGNGNTIAVDVTPNTLGNVVVNGTLNTGAYDLSGTSFSIGASGTLNTGTLWPYYKAIAIDHTKVPNSDLTNFPVVINGTYADLKTIANGGHVANTNGYDIQFFSNQNLTTKLKWEIETYNSTTGQLVAWVKVPLLSHTIDTVIYMAYGNSTVTTDQSDKTNVWDANFTSVWHMNNTVSGNNQTVANSTVNSENLTTHATTTYSGTQVTSPVGYGLSTVQSSGDYLSFPQVTLSGDWSIEGWAYLVSAPDQYSALFGNGSTGGGLIYNTNWFAGQYRAWNGTAPDDIVATTAISAGSWHHFVITRSGTALAAYVDGNPSGTTANGKNAIFQQLAMRGDNIASNSLRLDEVRISTAQRSADWIKTEYNNQNSPATFYTVASEVAASLPTTSTISVTGNWTNAGTFNGTGTTIKMTDNSGNPTFSGGNATYTRLWLAPGSGAGTYTIAGNNTFGELKDDGTVAHTVKFTAGSIQTIATWSVSGSAGQLITINSTNTGTHTLVKNSGGAVNADYLNIQHSVATPSYGIWFAGSHSVNNQGVASVGSGWFFQIENFYRGGGSSGGGSTDNGAGSCTDGIQNGNETGTDSGGRCASLSGTCSDGVQNGNETGTDSGGRCGVGGGGSVGGGESGAGTCTDQIQNGDETGVDTGGRCAPLSGTCSDGIKNGNETGIDTGGRCGSGGGGDSGFLFIKRNFALLEGVNAYLQYLLFHLV